MIGHAHVMSVESCPATNQSIINTNHTKLIKCIVLGSGVAEWARALSGDRTVNGSSPAAVKTFRFGTLAIPFTPPCQCLSDETLKAVGPFYLVSMPEEVKDPTSPHWNV